MRLTPTIGPSTRRAFLLLLLVGTLGHTEVPTDITALPPLPSEGPEDARPDWLIDPTPYRANVFRTSHPQEIALANGLVRRVFRLQPNVATVALDRINPPESLLRGVKPEAIVTINGHRLSVGGLHGQPNYAYLLPEWLGAMTADSGAFQFVSFQVGRPQARFAWLSPRHHAPDSRWPPPGVHLRLEFAPPAGPISPAIRVSVHYELYDGIPLFSKWIEVHNGSDHPITVDTFTSELLAVVEHSSWVESSDAVPFEVPQSLHVETDYAFGGFNHEQANRFMVHWQPDPQYETQVNYLRRQPCLLLIEPPAGPAQEVTAGQTFSSCRAFELIHDSTERERRGLGVRRMYRTIAPWVTENPLMHHLTTSDPARVRAAIDQANQVGFEMIILSFGSGFDMENEDPKHLAAWHDVASYAAQKGIDLGAYSL